MKKANYDDKKTVIEILSLSFYDNQSVNYIINHGHNRKEIAALMDYSFDVCQEFGDIWLSENREACALVLYPHTKRTTIKSVWFDIKLIFQAIGLTNIQKAIGRESKIKMLQPKVEMAYLWFIGVDPHHQHAGNGSNLLKEVIAEAQKRNLPVYLETSTLKNLPWYKRFGFEIYNQLELGYTLFFLKREPNK
jgi:Acetyltransferase (GNAT) family